MKRYILDQALKKSLRTKYLSQGGASRFRHFQKWFLETDIAHNIAALLSLFAFEGMCIRDYCYVVKSRPIIYMSGKVGIAWEDEIGRTQRIQLSPISIHLISQCGWDAVSVTPLKVLHEVYGNIAGHKATLEHFKKDQMAWFAEISSGPIHEHLSGVIKMTALPDRVYARLQTKQALSIKNQDDFDGSSDHIFSMALSGFLEPVGADKNPLIIDSILLICHRKQVHDTSNHKKWMLNQCFEHAISADQYGPVSSLILSWTIDLIANGTSGKAGISVSTIVNYVGVAARSIFSEFKNTTFSDWSAADYQLIYKKIIDTASSGQKRNMASALNSWHRFLVNWFDFPPISSKLHEEVAELPPHSNILWQNEYQKLLDWLNDSTMDERMVTYLRVMFNIAYCARLRINELLKLRLCDIKIFDEKIELQIKGTKSTAAMRYLLINRESLLDVELLKNRRSDELALNDDYIFGDPNKIGKIYKLGSIYSLANQLLKIVTGDRSIKFHTMSHTVISNGASEMLIGGTNSLLNPFSQFASDSAHYSIMTTYAEYMHTYEDAIRATIDRDLRYLKITSNVVQKWTGILAETIRKRKSREHIDCHKFYWKAIFEDVDITHFQNVSDGFDVEVPVSPQFLVRKSQIDFSKVLNILKDISANKPMEAILLRQSVDQPAVNNLLKQAKQIIINWQLSHDIRYSSSVEQVARSIRQITRFDFTKSDQPKLEEIRNWLIKNPITKEVANWLNSWLNLQKSGYIALNLEPDTRNLILFISKTGIPSTQLAIAHTSNLDKKYLLILQSIFYERYGMTVPQFTVKNRRGRPDSYLIFCSSRVSSKEIPKPASTSIAGLNALLFAALIMPQRSPYDNQ